MDNLTNKFKITVNCLTHVPPVYSQEFIGRVEQSILKAKETWDSEKWIVNHDRGLLKGHRYNDNERILNVILGNINRSFAEEFHKNGTGWEESYQKSPEAAKLWSEGATDEDLLEIANLAINYSTGCDYWYKYEKEW